MRAVFLQRDRDEWVALLQGNDVSCQPIGTAEDGLDHAQVVHNGASVVVDVPGVGAVKQFGNAYRLEHHAPSMPSPPPTLGEHTAAVLASLADVAADGDARQCRRTTRDLAHPLEGVRVLDFGTALAGPFGPMVLSDLGADVIKIDPINATGRYRSRRHVRRVPTRQAIHRHRPEVGRRPTTSRASSSRPPTSSTTTCAPASRNASGSDTNRRRR